MATDKSPRNEEDKPDLRIEPKEGAPISLQKFVEQEGGKLTNMNILVDGSGTGIVNDTPDFINCTAADREMQAMHFLGLNLPKLPEYMKKYLRMFYEDKTDEDFENLAKFGKFNDEFKQIIGMIGMLAGILNMAKKAKTGVRVYIQHPETHLHPSRQTVCAKFLIQIQEDFKFDPEEK